MARSIAGTAGRFVGQELDAQAVYTYSPQLQIAGGYARVLPGEFLKNTTPGESYQSTYLMVTYVFVGDRPAAPRGGAEMKRRTFIKAAGGIGRRDTDARRAQGVGGRRLRR